MDLVEFINTEIAQQVFHECEWDRKKSLVKKNSDNLETKGEFSFQLMTLLQYLLKIENDNVSPFTSGATAANSVNIGVKKRMDDLIERSKSWPIPLANSSLESDRCLLFLNRLKAVNYALKLVETTELFSSMKVSKTVHRFNVRTITSSKSCNLATLRSSLVALTLKNLLEYFVDSNEVRDECDFSIEVRPMWFKGKDSSASKMKQITIYTGIATDKDSNGIPMTAEEYESLRAKDMQLMAMHKYGVRMNDEDNFKKLIHHLGEAAVKFDLLETKHTSPILVKRNGQGCTKGAAFILYNSARIATLLRKFDSNVEKGIYPDLPASDDIDISLLKEEEEWNLVFNYILGFPNLIKRSVEGLEEGKCAPHLLMQFIFGLVNIFSVYYRRTRVLLEGPDHLIPLVHARIYLVKCIQAILTRVLAIINVDPIQYM